MKQNPSSISPMSVCFPLILSTAACFAFLTIRIFEGSNVFNSSVYKFPLRTMKMSLRLSELKQSTIFLSTVETSLSLDDPIKSFDLANTSPFSVCFTAYE